MKIKSKILVAALTAGVFAVTALGADVLTKAQVTTINDTFQKAPVPELAVKAAKVVQQAPKEQKDAIAVTIVKAVHAEHPAAMINTIAAIAKAAPETSPAVAAAAVKLAKKDINKITYAVVMAAPKFHEQIAQAIAKAVPESESTIYAKTRSVARSAATTGNGTTTTPGLIGGDEPADPPATVTSQLGADEERKNYSSPQ
ncbi:MAG: hypothetical protein K9N48_08990 [Verrucomicrobia bacterium]|nr:hypothetical protein [Verrucomicrobiota bacterium]MCF7709224.1 hypothetical protein [Verrucomicrobiota bacterium]